MWETSCLVRKRQRNGAYQSGAYRSCARKTAYPAFDEAFFAESDLLLVDFCAEGAITLYFYPENLKIDGATVSLDVRWDRDNAWTGGCAGQYCLITIPKGCTTAEVNITRDSG